MTNHTYHALVLGISNYQYLSPLAKAARDAQDVHARLVELGYPLANLTLLCDRAATHDAMMSQLTRLARQAQSSDTVLIFISGHGARFDGADYLCPVETQLDRLTETAITSQAFTGALRAIHCGQLVVLLDTCHAGGIGEPKHASRVRTGLARATFQRIATGRGRAIMAACRPEEVAWEIAGMPNGLFTHHLLAGLSGGAAKRGGEVRLSTLFGYVYEHVSATNMQHPFLQTASEDFVIANLTRGIQSSGAIPQAAAEILMEPAALRAAIHRAYDRPAFEVLCYDFGQDYHDLRGETMETKALYLVDRCSRQLRYEELVRRVIEDHPGIANRHTQAIAQ